MTAVRLLPDNEIPEAMEMEISRAWQHVHAASEGQEESTLQDAAAALYAARKVNYGFYPESDAAVEQEIDKELPNMAHHLCVSRTEAEQIFTKARRQGASNKVVANAKAWPPAPVVDLHPGNGDEPPPAESLEEYGTGTPPTKDKSPPIPLPFINLAAWQNSKPPNREWAVQDRVPLMNVTLLSGEGGVGKSILALHCGAATVLGRDWLGTLPEPGPVLVVCCEDDEHELHRRLDQIVEHYGVTFGDLSKDMHAISLAGEDAMMAVPNKGGLIVPTKLFDRVSQAASDIRPRLIVVDNSADVFGGNENDRAQVRQFITLLRGTAIAAGAGLILTSHPSLTGVSTGTGLSGSTAWNASVRSRLYFKRATTDKDEEPDPDLRVLEVMKSNYGPVGETITPRWKDGLFLPVGGTGGLDKLAAQQRHDEIFMTLLAQFSGQGRNVSDKPTAPTYAPAMFHKEQAAKGIRKAEMADAMRRLFAANRIHVEQYGKPSRPYTRLAAGIAP
jgi:RecA-family ATPase